MTIKVKEIKCPRLIKSCLSRVGSTPSLEIFVKLDVNDDAIPKAVMCDEYDNEKGICELDQKSCTYNEWKQFSE